MAVRQRQERRSDYKVITGRLPEQDYKILEDFAWERRITLSAAVSMLLEKAMKAEGGEAYTPDTGSLSTQ